MHPNFNNIQLKIVIYAELASTVLFQYSEYQVDEYQLTWRMFTIQMKYRVGMQKCS